VGTYVHAELRRLVARRADYLCEYCLLSEEDTFFGCEIDHIVSEKHGGLTREDNLAYACLFCNRSKGSDIASLLPGSEILVRFFHPRTEPWSDHFELDRADGTTIQPRSETGEVTARILGFNQIERLLERQLLREAGRYPSPAARRRMDR